MEVITFIRAIIVELLNAVLFILRGDEIDGDGEEPAHDGELENEGDDGEED